MKRDFLYRYRYILALAVFIMCLLFRISGSSIGMWSGLLGHPDSRMIGSARQVRSDEWGMLTVMCLAQEYNPAGAYERYAPVGEELMTDQGIVYALPSKDFLTVFRPFYWGYLLFGGEVGLSWYWCGRMIALFLLMFELGMMMTKKDKALSLFLAVCVSFAPFLQWWFAVNCLVEMLIWAALFLLGLRYLLTGTCLWRRISAGAAMGVSIVGYVLTFYPAWMAPVAYGFLPVFIWMIYDYVKGRRQGTIRSDTSARWKKIMPWVLCALIAAAGLLYLILTSWDTIQKVLNSAYPGRGSQNRGGAVGWWLLKYPFSVGKVRMDDPTVVENSSIICFAPIGLILSVYVMMKNKKTDALLIVLLAAEIFLTFYYCIGFSETAAKYLLLSFTSTHRGSQVIGFLRLFVLTRALYCKKVSMKIIPSVIAAVTAAGFAMWISWCFTQYDVESFRHDYWGQFPAYTCLIFAVLAGVFFLFLRYRAKRRNKYAALLAAGAVVFISGIQVNPVRFGTDVITESPIYQEINRIASEEPDAVWVEIGADYPLGNLVAMAGGNCLTTSQTYPELIRWEIFGTSEEQMEIYNRYCHIRASLGTETSCVLKSTDYVEMILDDHALRELSVDYVLAWQNMLQIPQGENWSVGFELIAQCGNFFIYQCVYE